MGQRDREGAARITPAMAQWELRRETIIEEFEVAHAQLGVLLALLRTRGGTFEQRMHALEQFRLHANLALAEINFVGETPDASTKATH